MLNKLLLNNQIITNKKRIIKARIQTINKLVQKIRKLKVLDEKNPNNAKIKSNLEKAQQVMGCVKKMKVLDIIRKVLILSKKPSAILTNGQALYEDIAVALLAKNKILLDIVTALRTILHLDDKNLKWRDEIMELSKRKKKLLKSNGQKKINKPAKTEKKPGVKGNPWKEEDLENDNPNKLTDASSPANEWTVEQITDATEEKISSKKIEQGTKVNVEKKIVTQESPPESSDEEDSISQNQKPVKTVDPFFFTETGENYLSTVVIDRIQPEAPVDGLIRRERRDKAIRPYKRKNNSYSNNNKNDRRQSMQDSRSDKTQPYERSLNAKPQIADEKIHPSWAAKQKLKPIITQFTGQKITFGDDGVGQTVQSAGKNSSKSSYKSKTAGKMQVPEEKLHPSWAAKQKLKTAIIEFKGKKTTFDE